MSPQIGDIAHFAREDGTGLLGKSWQTVAERDAQRWIGEFIDVAARLEAKVLNRVEMRRFVECRERKSPSAFECVGRCIPPIDGDDDAQRRFGHLHHRVNHATCIPIGQRRRNDI